MGEIVCQNFFLLARFSYQLNVTAVAVYDDNVVGAEIFSTRFMECHVPPY